MTFFFLKDSKLFYRIIIALTPDSQVDKIKKYNGKLVKASN